MQTDIETARRQLIGYIRNYDATVDDSTSNRDLVAKAKRLGGTSDGLISHAIRTAASRPARTAMRRHRVVGRTMSTTRFTVGFF